MINCAQFDTDSMNQPPSCCRSPLPLCTHEKQRYDEREQQNVDEQHIVRIEDDLVHPTSHEVSKRVHADQWSASFKDVDLGVLYPHRGHHQHHRRQQPSIDINKCKRKLNLYSDNQRIKVQEMVHSKEEGKSLDAHDKQPQQYSFYAFEQQHQQQQHYQQQQQQQQQDPPPHPRHSFQLRHSLNQQQEHLQPMQQQAVPYSQEEQNVYYFHPDTGCIQAASVMDLRHPNLSLQDLLTKENYWIDITSPSVVEMRMISKIFRIHPLSTEDILSQEVREKCDVFRDYLFVCYRAFVHQDPVLRPVSIYNIIHKRSILTFHYHQVPHLQLVYERIGQLREYIVVAPEWINYAILDEVTDQFAPLIQQIEAEVETIDDPAMLLNVKDDETDMVLRIGSCRKQVMQLLRLLGTKAEVVKSLIKRLDERGRDEKPSRRGGSHACNITADNNNKLKMKSNPTYHHRRGDSAPSLGYFKDKSTARRPHLQRSPSLVPIGIDEGDEDEDEDEDGEEGDNGRIYPDVALYLGDVQDHLITMLQNLSHYETVLARAHSNYLAQISIKLSQTSNSTNHVIGRLTVFATILMPMNLVTGLWGMNVKVPGKDYDDLLYFFWIVSSLAVFAVAAFTVARRFQFF